MRNGPGLAVALDRASMPSSDTEAQELAAFGLRRIGGDAADVLEIGRAIWQTETHGGSGLVLLTREMLVVVLAPVAQGLLRRMAPPACVQVPLTVVRDLIGNDDEGPIIYFLADGEHPDFLLRFERSGDRDRLLGPILSAHRGDFSRWTEPTAPGDYDAVFRRTLSSLEAIDPGGLSPRDWAAQQHPDHDPIGPIGLAVDWRVAELDDLSGLTPSRRVLRVSSPWPWADDPDARRTILRLGEDLFDAGHLGPPYDERSFDISEPLSSLDAGPARLVAALTLAGLAHAVRDPRAPDFTEFALRGVHDVPPSVFSSRLRELWVDIAPLPSEEAMRELEIWEDADVRAILTAGGNPPVVDASLLSAEDRALVDTHMQAVTRCRSNPAPATVLDACLTGVRAFEGMSPVAPTGWRKLVLFTVSDYAHRLWGDFELTQETAMLAQWVVCSIEQCGWGPDGNSTPLGQHHSYAINLAGQTGIGVIVVDPESGLASAPTGNEARLAAQNGRF